MLDSEATPNGRRLCQDSLLVNPNIQRALTGAGRPSGRGCAQLLLERLDLPLQFAGLLRYDSLLQGVNVTLQDVHLFISVEAVQVGGRLVRVDNS